MLATTDAAADAGEDEGARATTVLVVDDDPAIRRSVARLIRSAGFDARTFASPVEFLRHPLPDGPSCVLLDMCMDGMTGLEVQQALRRNARHIPIVFLSGRATIPIAAAGFKQGADDFLEKPARPQQLIEAVSRAIEHDRGQCADRADRAALQRRVDRLTPREQEVMGLVVTGLLNKQVAAELGISEKTVKVHRSRVMDKMEVESLAALVHIAERLGTAAASSSSAPQPVQ
jgi:FixJ family two-component response regulator